MCIGRCFSDCGCHSSSSCLTWQLARILALPIVVGRILKWPPGGQALHDPGTLTVMDSVSTVRLYYPGRLCGVNT